MTLGATITPPLADTLTNHPSQRRPFTTASRLPPVKSSLSKKRSSLSSTSQSSSKHASLMAAKMTRHQTGKKSADASMDASSSTTNNNYVIMVPSRRALRPATVAFSLDHNMEQFSSQNANSDSMVQIKRRDDSKFVKKVNGKHLAVYYKFGDQALEYRVIKEACIRAGLVKAPQNGDFTFNLLWSRHLKSHEYYKLNKHQKVNHFPGSEALSRKDSMHRALKRQKQKYGKKEYGFFPESYFLPKDQDLIHAKLKKGKIFLLKPPGLSCGRGIELIHSIDDLPELDEDGKCKHLIQEYLPNPFLIDRKKWDLRIYVLVSSYNPLRIYVFNNGLVRFCTEDYDAQTKSRFAHLTNYSVNKQSDAFVFNTNHEEDDKGSKWSIQGLKRYFARNGFDDSDLWRQVDDVIVKTIIAVEGKVADLIKRYMPGRRSQSCFELYGFDVMVCSNNSGNPVVNSARVSSSTKVQQNASQQHRASTAPDTSLRSSPDSMLVPSSVGTVSPSPASSPTSDDQEKLNPQMIKPQLSAHLIEVNVAPSLAMGSALDKHIKRHLLTDTLHLIGITPYNRKKIGDQIELRKKKREKKREKQEQEQQRINNPLLAGKQETPAAATEEKPPHTLKDLLNPKFKLKRLTLKDYNLASELQDEEDRMGNFVRVFPTAEHSYSRFFQNYSYTNAFLFKWLNTTPSRQESLLRKYEQSKSKKKKSKQKTKRKSTKKKKRKKTT